MIGSIQWKNHLLKLWFSLLKNSSLTVIKKLDWHAKVYHKKHLISQLLWDHIQASLSWAWLAWLRVSQSCNQSVSQSVFSTGGSTREKICFQAHLACWQNSFPFVVGLRALAFCCHFSFLRLSSAPTGYPQFPATWPSPWQCAPRQPASSGPAGEWEWVGWQGWVLFSMT